METKILQFGEGNFLRCFIDWMVQKMNDRAGFDGRVQIIQPIGDELSAPSKVLNARGGRYHTCLRGFMDGRQVEEIETISSVEGVDLAANVEKYATLPSLRFVVSNTTEAGIQYVKGQDTFPAKVLRLVKARFEAGLPGLVFIPCELIEHNGDNLKKCVLQHLEDETTSVRQQGVEDETTSVRQQGVEDETASVRQQGVRDYIERECVFCSTLVDRIVAGRPDPESAERYAQELGERDDVLVCGEPFHFFVIETPAGFDLERELPLKAAGVNVVYTPDMQPYRTRKVRFLNAAHTSIVYWGLERGFEEVAQVVGDKEGNAFLRKILFDEVYPTVNLPDQEKTAYANSILERFANPFAHHKLASIALNTIAKWKTRCLPVVCDYYRMFGKVPACMMQGYEAIARHYDRGTFRRMLTPLFASVVLTASAAVDVRIGRQLFVDDYLIASTNGVVRHFNRPVKEFDGPVLWPETAYERPTNATHRIAPSVTVNSSGLWWDPHKRVFRLWYESGWISHLSYAESADGVHWTRPDCGIVPGTNLLLPDVKLDTWSVFPDYAAKDPHSAWRMMVSLEGSGATDNLLFTSEDGIRWNAAGKAGQSGDCTTLFYDPFRAHWVFSLRDWREPVRRCRRIWTSPTFGGRDCLWSYPGSKQNVGLATPSRWLELDADDKPDLSVTRCRPELYNVDAVAYESVMLGLFKIFHPLPGDNADCVRAGMPKITDLEFAYSRDGINYVRPDRRAAIPAERWGSGKWDTGYLSAVGGICVIRGERLWFYYAATRGDATTGLPNGPDWKGGFHWRDSGMHFNASIGAASLRRDGFAGMVADGRGEIVTKPLAFSGGHLFVNAECRFGSVRAEILGADGKPVPGFSADDCTAIERCDTTRRELVFRGGDLKALGAKGVRVRFGLHCATLYAFWLSPTARGESLGYVAAGGPDYPGLRDLPKNDVIIK